MSRVALLLVVAAACKTDDEFPVVPGGSPPAGSGGDLVDALIDGPNDRMLMGTVCLQLDLRRRTACATTGVGGVRVQLGPNATLTMGDGSFQLTPPLAPSVWRVGGAASGTGAVMSTITPLGLVHDLPTMDADDYLDLSFANSVVYSDGQGSIVVRVVKAGAPVVGATATATPPSPNDIRYDGANAIVWDTDSTGLNGTVWIPGIEAGSTVVRVTPAVGAPISVTVPVENNTITFATVEVP